MGGSDVATFFAARVARCCPTAVHIPVVHPPVYVTGRQQHYQHLTHIPISPCLIHIFGPLFPGRTPLLLSSPLSFEGSLSILPPRDLEPPCTISRGYPLAARRSPDTKEGRRPHYRHQHHNHPQPHNHQHHQRPAVEHTPCRSSARRRRSGARVAPTRVCSMASPAASSRCSTWVQRAPRRGPSPPISL